MSKTNKPPIINCHTHVFTGDYVPPFLAKTYLPEPIYRLFSLQLIIRIIRWYYKKVKPIIFKNSYKNWKRFWYHVEIFIRRYYILGFIKFLVEAYLFISICFYVGIWIFDIDYNHTGYKSAIVEFLTFLKNSGWIVVIPSFWFKILFFILIILFFKSIRNLTFYLLRQFKILPGKAFTNLFQRYVQIGLFSKYKTQKGIYDKLKKQYPLDTHFVGLPMDMEYMKAGDLKENFTFKNQMEGLLTIKQRKQDINSFHPFVFAHPERMKDKKYFDCSVNKTTGEVKLDKNCFLAQYIEKHKFSGVKIYPALGYYPFDISLLLLWKYCVQKEIPIMTHCIKGTIFFRGKKNVDWDSHQIFTEGKVNKSVKKESTDDDEKVDFNINADYIELGDKPLYLNKVKNIDFCNNFTHPLNYLCLLDNLLLAKVIKYYIDENKKKGLQKTGVLDSEINKIIAAFGYKNEEVKRGLADLKVCFAHFGGDDQWKRFLESDRDNYTSQLILEPEKGIDFFKNAKGNNSPGKLAYIWKYVDWYTIICSIMLQYKNVYADISYILHDEVILPLLKQTLSNPKLKTKVLYGSDFYVVRNHKSDKAILADMRAGLTEDEFDKIARYNPRNYLNLGTYLPHHIYGIPSN